MQDPETKRLYNEGVEHLSQGKTLSALSCFEHALKKEDSPSIRSYYAFCIAKERGQIKKAMLLCKEALEQEPDNSIHYLNLGRIYLFTRQKVEAITIFREGLNHETNKEIIEELDNLVPRKTPVIPFLKRENPINKYIGIILKALRLR
jgi:tetratricopeptide (TPR) repeat protein